MIFIIEIFVVFLVLGLWWYKNDRSKYAKYPPGPTRLPVIGNLLDLIRNKAPMPSTTYKKLADKYGDVMFIKVGQVDTVVFHGPDAIHEMLIHEKAVGRYQYEFIKDRHDNRNLGIIWGHSMPWQNLRRFTMRNLRDFGFGKSSTMDVVINDEIEKFFKSLREEVKASPNGIIHVEDMFSVTAVNVLWRLVSGVSYDYKDPKVLRWVQLNSDWLRSTTIGMDLSDPFPFLRNWFPDKTGRTTQKKLYKELFEYGKELLNEQRKTGISSDTEPETFIDVFTRKVEETKNDPDTDFNDDQFVITILDLFLGGSETSSNTLNFGVLYMMLNPEVQEKVQSELDHEVPDGVPIDSTMKSRLPYTHAAVLEMLRQSTVIPMPSSREATEDFYFRGHFIRKGTALLPNMYALHYCEKLWGDPENFRPERFLNKEGTAIDPKMADRLKAFGAGKRYCLGQSLAEITMFLYFASTLRNFKFVKVPGTNPTAEPLPGLTLTPKPFDVRVIDRSRLKQA